MPYRISTCLLLGLDCYLHSTQEGNLSWKPGLCKTILHLNCLARLKGKTVKRNPKAQMYLQKVSTYKDKSSRKIQ